MFHLLRHRHSRSIVVRGVTLLFVWLVATMVIWSAGGTGSARSEMTETKDPVEKEETQRELVSYLRTAGSESRGSFIDPRICVLRMPLGTSPSPTLWRPGQTIGHRLYNGLLAPLRC
jgi:hypothetical protein